MIPSMYPFFKYEGSASLRGLPASRVGPSSPAMPLPDPSGLRSLFPLRRWLALGLSLLSAILPASAAPAAAGLQGVTEPVEDVLLSTAVAGTIAAVNVKEGATVKKGAVLLELDKARETLDVTRRRIARDLLAAELERTRQLFRSSSAVPREELDKKEAEAAAAVVEHEIALENLRLKLVVSPIDGVVVDVPFAVGEACQALQAVARVVNTARVRFVSHALPAEAATVAVGQSAQLEIAGTDNALIRVPGQVTYVAPVVDAASGLIRVAAEFPNADGRVRPGLAGRLLVAPHAR